MGATVVYDFETSGLSPYTDDVIEVGARCIETGKEFNSLVIPLSKKGVSNTITDITGITNELLKREGVKTITAFISFLTYLQDIYTLFDGLTLVAHNGTLFDDIFLRRMHRLLQEEGYTQFDRMMERIVYIDSLLVSRYVHPTRRNHRMGDMCGMYNVTNTSSHRAMGDVDALVKVWAYLMDHLRHTHADVSGSHLKYILYLA
jgi:DNA polymerase-3 subunit alpha (Gram-positive type)